ncbi:MAG: thioredoxin family protein [Aestuariivita sp.]|uniref:thioredoxin family protein n=1 Tax=Aestuariivita sp. TaxID=1872407 RepID=UPI003BB1C4F5
MKRRAFVLSALGACVALPGIALAGGLKTVAFDDSDPIATALAEGKTVFVDFTTDWCSTCAAQDRAMEALRSANPEYDANIVFVRVDYDKFGNAPVATSRNIPRRSTLIVLKGEQELGRIVAGTSKSDIKALMDTALKAATTS